VSKPITVLVVDDHSIVRRGIKALLSTERDIEVIGEAEDGFQAVEVACELIPDVVLMDLEMPKKDGIQAIQEIIPSCPEIGILVLTSFATDHRVFPAIKAGAHGYLLKDSDPEQLLNAIRHVHRREPSLHPTIANKLLDELSEVQGAPALPAELTEDEVSVLRLLASGRDTSQIATGVARSPEQVRKHLNVILSKLHLASRTQAVLYALKQGLASPDEAAPRYIQKLLDTFRQLDRDEPAPRRGPRAPGDIALGTLISQYSEFADELSLAGQIQSSFLPETAPAVEGWEFTARLLSAKETSGDFYDFIQLSEQQLAIVIADVTNKGMGAALFMALARTLIRTYAAQYPADPGEVLRSVNQRILSDTHGGPYVTLFYGVLNLNAGEMRFSSAGHPPGYLLHELELEPLPRTGPPLGAYLEGTWEVVSTSIGEGDKMLLYTDGVSEAQNATREFFGEERLEKVLSTRADGSAHELAESVLSEVAGFVGTAPRSDDISLIAVQRQD
jgi:NarL family two-component system response regulator LiaR